MRIVGKYIGKVRESEGMANLRKSGDKTRER